MYWLGLDVGTGGSRALLVDAKGVVRYSFTAPHHEMLMLKPLWAEQEPDDWWRAGQLAIQGVLREAGTPGAAIKGIGLTGQMHGLVLLNEGGKVIRPALIWCDQRSQPQVDFIEAKLGRAAILQYIANPKVAVAERLFALQAHRRICNRCLRRERHGAVRRGESVLVEKND